MKLFSSFEFLKGDTADKIKFWFTIIFRALLIVAIAIAGANGDLINAFFVFLILASTFFPLFVEKKFRVDYPSEFELLILVFIYAALYLGDIHHFYTYFWWWDILLHSLSGMIISIFAFTLVYMMNNKPTVALKMSPIFIVLFTFSFAVAMGVVWEIMEFSMDSIIGTNWQHRDTGVLDTMKDLICDTLSALFTSIVGYFYLTRKWTYFSSLQAKLVNRNPKIFRLFLIKNKIRSKLIKKEKLLKGKLQN
jgi:hypothetical protein